VATAADPGWAVEMPAKQGHHCKENEELEKKHRQH